jgi:hypothetical protein
MKMPTSNTPLPAATLLALADDLEAVIDRTSPAWSVAEAYRAARLASPVTLEEARLARIDLYAGETCEAGSPECGPVEYSDVEGVPLCAGCWKALCDEWNDGEEDNARRLAGEGGAA